MEYQNREFKAVVQDMSHVYLGAQMSVTELTGYEDVPFKIKAVFNKYYGGGDKRDKPISELLGSLKKEDFEYQVCKQLRLKFKSGIYTEKKNGESVYVSKTLSLDEFIMLHASNNRYFDEEIVFNKLALLAFST